MGLFGPPDVEKLEARSDTKGLARALAHSDPEVASRAAHVLARLGDSRGIDFLKSALTGFMTAGDGVWAGAREETWHCGEPAELLHFLGPIALSPLLEGLKDRQESVRANAARALGELEDGRAVAPLIEMVKAEQQGALGDPLRGSASLAARDAFSRLGEAAVEPLITVLMEEPIRIEKPMRYGTRTQHDPHSSLREYAARALGDVGDCRAVDALVSALRDPASDGSCNMFPRRPRPDILGRAGTNRSTYGVRKQAAISLGKLGDAGATRALAEAFDDAAYDEKKAILEALSKIADDGGLETVLTGVLDPDSAVQYEASRVLEDWGESAAPLLSVLGPQEELDEAISWSRASNAPNEPIIRIIERIGASGDSRFVRPLARCLPWRDALGHDEEISAALDALSSIGGPTARQAAEGFRRGS